jgi:hypothetical protein
MVRRGAIAKGYINGYPAEETLNYVYVRVGPARRGGDIAIKPIPGKGIQLVLQRRPDGAMELRSIGFSKARFKSVEQIRNWLRKYGY